MLTKNIYSRSLEKMGLNFPLSISHKKILNIYKEKKIKQVN